MEAFDLVDKRPHAKIRSLVFPLSTMNSFGNFGAANAKSAKPVIVASSILSKEGLQNRIAGAIGSSTKCVSTDKTLFVG